MKEGDGAYAVVKSDKKENVAYKIFFDNVGMQNGAGILRELDFLSHFDHPCLPNQIDFTFWDNKNFKFEGRGNKTSPLILKMPKADYDGFTAITEIKEITYDHLLCMFFDLLCALEYLHKNDIVHMDLKPSNILIFTDENLGFHTRLCDFNLSIRGDFDKCFEKAFTSWYRAPEVSLDKKILPASDIWALGCIIYEAYTKKAIMYKCSSRKNAKINRATYEKLFSYNIILENRYQYWNEKVKHNTIAFLLAHCLNVDPEERSSANQILKLPIFDKFKKRKEYYDKKCTEPIIDIGTITHVDKNYINVVLIILNNFSWYLNKSSKIFSLGLDLYQRIKKKKLVIIDVLASICTSYMYYEDFNDLDRFTSVLRNITNKDNSSYQENENRYYFIKNKLKERIPFLIEEVWKGKIYSNHIIRKINPNPEQLIKDNDFWRTWWSLLKDRRGLPPISEKSIYEMYIKIYNKNNDIESLQI